MSGTEEMSKALKASTPGFCDMPSTIVRASIVQASTVYNDTPKTIEKAGEFIAQAASDGAQLVVFPEAYIGGYPRGYRFGIGVGVHNEAGRDCFRRYHASAIVVPGIELYCAPTADGSTEWQSSMMHIALEGGCFVMSACQFCKRKDFPEHADYLFTDWYDDQHQEAIVSQGGSVIISPLGKILAGPNFESECLVTADLDLGDIARAKLYFDVVGHYSRPDIFNLRVNENQNKPVTFVSKSVKAADDSEPQDN